MITKYYSTWIISLSILWYLGYLLKVPLIDTIDLYYCLWLICGGFVLFILYLKYSKHYQFDTSFLITLIVLHFYPLYIISKLPRGNYGKETLVITYFMYTMYLTYLNKSVFTVYLIDEYPRNFTELKEFVRLNE